MFNSLVMVFFGFGKKWFALCANIYKSIFKTITSTISENKAFKKELNQHQTDFNTEN